MFASSRGLGPAWEVEVNRTASLPGRTCGQRWPLSSGFNFVTGTGVPPPEGTRERTPVLFSAAMILPSSPQLPPKPLGASDSVTAAPPSTAIFLSLPSAKNPIQSPAGEKNGNAAFSVPGSGVTWL